MEKQTCITLKDDEYIFPSNLPIVEVCTKEEAQCLGIVSFRQGSLGSIGSPIIVYLKREPNRLTSKDMEAIESAIIQSFPALTSLINRQVFVKYVAGGKYFIDRFGFFRSLDDYLSGTTLGVFSFSDYPVLGCYKHAL